MAGRCPTWCKLCRFHRCSSWRGRSRSQIVGKIVEIPEIHTVQSVQTCENLNTRSSTDGHTVVHGWPHGRPRMASRSSTDGLTGSSTDGLTGSSTDGHGVVHGWPRGRPRMATGSSTDGHGCRPRMATGSSTDGHRVVSGWPEVVSGWPVVVHGWPEVVYGRPKVLPASRPRMAGVQKQGGGDVPQYIKMAARAASSRLSTDDPQVVRGCPNQCTNRRCGPGAASEARLLRNDECRWTRQCGRPWRLHSCRSSTRLPLMANLRLPCSSRLPSWKLFWLLGTSNPLSL